MLHEQTASISASVLAFIVDGGNSSGKKGTSEGKEKFFYLTSLSWCVSAPRAHSAAVVHGRASNAAAACTNSSCAPSVLTTPTADTDDGFATALASCVCTASECGAERGVCAGGRLGLGGDGCGKATPLEGARTRAAAVRSRRQLREAGRCVGRSGVWVGRRAMCVCPREGSQATQRQMGGE